MSRHKRLDVYLRMRQVGLVPLFHNSDLSVATELTKASVAGGATVLEFTNRGDHSLGVFAELEKILAKNHPEVMLGVGTIVDAPTAALYIAAGAAFVVSPSLDDETAVLCNKRKIPYLPGCGSVTEIQRAHALGVEVCKVFPGKEVGGPGFVKNVMAPLSWADLLASGGVKADKENIREWLAAGTACLGMGSDLYKADWIKAKDWGAVTAAVKQVLAWVQEVRAELKK